MIFKKYLIITMSKEIHMGGFGIAILFSLFSFIYLFFVAIAIGVIFLTLGV